MCKVYDCTEIFKTKAGKTITDIRIKSKCLDIPFLISFAVKNDSSTTKYVSYVNTSVKRIGMLSRDVIPDCINIMFNGFHAVKLDTMDQDVESHMDAGSRVPDPWRDRNDKRVYDSREDFRMQLLPSIQKVQKVCSGSKIPYFMVFAVADDGNDTLYECFEPDWVPEPLTEDILSGGRKVVRERYVSFIDEIMEDDLPLYGADGKLGQHSPYAGDASGTGGRKEAGGTGTVEKKEGSQNGIPECWRTYKKGG